MENELIEKARTIGRGYVYFIYADGLKEKRRLFTSNGSVCVIGKGRKNKGHYLTDEIGSGFKKQLMDVAKFEEKPINEKWQYSINKAINLLEKSGLWTDLLNDLKTANAVGYKKIRAAYEADNINSGSMSYDEKQKEICRKAGKHKAVASCGFGSEEENKNHNGCKIGAAECELKRQETNKLLQAGKWLRVAALSHDELGVKVIFRDALNRERAFFMAAETYNSIPFGVDASIEDYEAKGSIEETSNLNIYEGK